MAAPGTTLDAAGLVSGARRWCVLTGAGISTDSGIPDFRGPNGIWTKNPQAARLVDLDAYAGDAELRRESWRRRATHPAFAARPNAAHRALVDVHRRGRLPVTLTQNIDGLHQRAGLPADAVIELHGTVHETECLGCARRRPVAEALQRLAAGDPDPACLDCGGVLKSATVFFGQSLDPEAVQSAAQAVVAADVLICIGTSLSVNPVAGLVPLAARAGVPIVIVNADPTPYDDLAACVVREPIGVAVTALARAAAGESRRDS